MKGALFAKIAAGVKDHSPEILLVVGITSLVAGGVVACIETKKACDILDEQNAKKDEIIENHSEEELKLPEVKKEIFKVKAQTVGKLVWNYKYSVGLVALGTTCVMVQYKVLKGRYLGAVAAANFIQAAYDKAIDRVEQKWGEAGLRYVKYGIEQEEYEETEEDPETGKKHKVKKYRDAIMENVPDHSSPYFVVFDENSALYRENQGSIVHMRSQAQVYEAGLNERYNQGIPVMYDDDLIVMTCGVDSEYRQDELRNTGWYKRDKSNRDAGDDCIDLHLGTFVGCDPETGEPKVYLFMDPNVPGVVSFNAGKSRIRTGGKYISQV